MGYLIDWIGFRLSKTDEPFLMLDPFTSYKEKIIERLDQVDPLPHREIEESRDMESPKKEERGGIKKPRGWGKKSYGEQGKKSYE